MATFESSADLLDPVPVGTLVRAVELLDGVLVCSSVIVVVVEGSCFAFFVSGSFASSTFSNSALS